MQAFHTASCQLDVSGFGCIRGGKVLFRDLEFTVQAGQVLVVTGSNGAGKSTLLRSLAGLLAWRAGQLHWCGQAVSARDAGYQQHMAYMGHQAGMNEVMSSIENLQFALHLMGVSRPDAQVHEVLRSLDLHEIARRPLGRLSQGQRRRLGLARVQLSGRRLWLLDEPDNSLDGQGAQWLGQSLKAHADAGGLAIVVTHRGLDLPESVTTQQLRLPGLTAKGHVTAQTVEPCAC